MKPVRVLLGAGILAIGCGMSAGAFAQSPNSCQVDFGKIAQRRQVEIDAVNKMTKKLGGKLDPIAACPRFRNLTAIQSQLVSYLTTNKDWCHVPDDAMKGAIAEKAKFSSIAAKACSVAAQVQKQKQQAQQGGAPQNGNAFNAPEKLHLPTGPL